MAKDFQKTYSETYDFRVSSDNLNEPLCFGDNRLYQLGRIHCHSHTVIQPHTQLNYIELTVATDGRGKVITNGDEVEISAGDIYISFAGDFHSIISDEVYPLKYDFLSFQSAVPIFAEAMEKIISERHAADARIIRSDLIMRLISQAMKELREPDGFTDKVMAGILDQIFAETAREFMNSGSDDRDTAESDGDLLCFKLMNYIDNHIYTITNLRELEKITNYSYNYMSNLFKKVTKDTLQSYYRNRRLEAAALLLTSGDFSIGQVAQMLNYSSIYSFSLAFKKKYGYPPTKAHTKKEL